MNQASKARATRVIAIGASNLTRGFHMFVATARAAWGHDVEIVTAQGLGRSFCGASRVHFRSLPGILECGLWERLDSMPRVPTRAVVTDIGNDVMFGYPPAQILSRADECVVRLQEHTPDITLTALPLVSIRSLSTSRYVLFRSILFPFSKMRLEQAVELAAEVDNALINLAFVRGVRLVIPRDEWYGIDPIHIRPGCWPAAWREILGCEPATRPTSSLGEALRLYLMRPQRRLLFGHEQLTPQTGARLPAGGRIWMY